MKYLVSVMLGDFFVFGLFDPFIKCFKAPERRHLFLNFLNLQQGVLFVSDFSGCLLCQAVSFVFYCIWISDVGGCGK